MRRPIACKLRALLGFKSTCSARILELKYPKMATFMSVRGMAGGWTARNKRKIQHRRDSAHELKVSLRLQAGNPVYSAISSNICNSATCCGVRHGTWIEGCLLQPLPWEIETRPPNHTPWAIIGVCSTLICKRLPQSFIVLQQFL
jgi:hypothetical protein